MPEPDYLPRTREAWTRMSVDFLEPGRRAWSSPEITWGIWDLPESQIQALGGLNWFQGKATIELGCGTAYISAWLARLGAQATGIDPTPAQLANARLFQKEFDLEFPLLEGYAEELPFSDESFDFAVSEYGAAIWADPYRWIPEAARVLRSGGWLVFLRNTPLSVICAPDTGPATPGLRRDWFGMHRVEWNAEEPEEFHLPTGPMIRLLIDSGFEIEALIELQAPEGAAARYEHMTAAWARRWPSEEIWRVKKRD